MINQLTNLCWRPLSSKRERQLLNNENDSIKQHNHPLTLSYFLGGGAGAGGAGAGGAGLAGAGASAGFASAGFASSLTAGFSGALALHPIPIAAKLITKTSASNSKIHFFMYLHLLSD
jgi:hypothetical protein